jgi:hypothetical protein
LDLKARGTLVTDEAQPADEHHRGEAVLLPTNDGELALDLSGEVIRIASRVIHEVHLCSQRRYGTRWQDRKHSEHEVNALMAGD